MPGESESIVDRLAGAPISWGICEVPGWGRMLPLERVLSEMAGLGLRATELGAPGFLPASTDELVSTLDRHGLALVGGFVPLVLHRPEAAGEALAQARATAQLFRDAGGHLFVTAVVVDAQWSPRAPLDEGAWSHLCTMLDRLDELVAEHGLVQALHPHIGTLVETAEDVGRVLEASNVGWCLDTGHLTVGGVDPLQFVEDAGDRVVHVHLKDVDQSVAGRLVAGEIDLLHAVQAGLFRPLGRGDVAIAEVVRRLEGSGYDGWYVLEQDTAITGDEPPVGGGPLSDVRESVEFLRSVAAGLPPRAR